MTPPEGAAPAPPLLELDGVRKSYGSIQALRGVSFTVRRGEVVALVGDNGAGKSTLVKIIAGVVPASGGTMRIDGAPLSPQNPREAREAGIESVYQDLALVEDFDVASNFFLGRELHVGGLLAPLKIARTGEMRRQAAEAVRRLGIKMPGIDEAVVREMSGGQRQASAIARAAFWRSKLLILDEPTAALGVAETREVNRLVGDLARDTGVGIILISHNMQQVAGLCDKAIVLQQGRHVATLDRPDPESLVGYITGARPPQPGLSGAAP